MIAGFLPDAYPTSIYGAGLIPRRPLERILKQSRLNNRVITLIENYQVSYILLENDLPLAAALAAEETRVHLIHRNDAFSLWKVPKDISPSDPTPAGSLPTQRDDLQRQGSIMLAPHARQSSLGGTSTGLVKPAS